MCLRWQLGSMRESVYQFYFSKKENVNMREACKRVHTGLKVQKPWNWYWLSSSNPVWLQSLPLNSKDTVFHMLSKDFCKHVWTYVFLCHARSHFELFRLHHPHCHQSYYILHIFKTEIYNVSTVPTCINYVHIPLMSDTFPMPYQLVPESKTLESKFVPVASDASDASFLVSLATNRNFSD